SRSLAVARKEYKRQGERERRRVFTASRDMEEIRRLTRHLWGGFSASTLVELREFSADPGRRPPARAAALEVIADWHEVAGEKDRARGFRYSAMLADTAPPDGSRRLAFLRDGGKSGTSTSFTCPTSATWEGRPEATCRSSRHRPERGCA